MSRLSGWGVVVAVGLLVAACSSTSSSASSCQVTGTYAVTYARDKTRPGDCMGLPDDLGGGDTYSVSESGGNATVAISSLTGTCDGPLNACKLTLACDATSADGGAGSTGQFSITFTSSGLTGYFTLGMRSPACSANYNLTGTRK